LFDYKLDKNGKGSEIIYTSKQLTLADTLAGYKKERKRKISGKKKVRARN